MQAKSNKVLRVLPQENEAVNECWISDKDQFSYEALNSDERLTKPMVKQGNEWHETDWQTALEYITHGLSDIRKDYGAEAIAALASPHSTLEELALLNKLMRGIGSSHIDARPRHLITPWMARSSPGLVCRSLNSVNCRMCLCYWLILAQGPPAAGSALQAKPRKKTHKSASCMRSTMMR